MQFNPAEQRVGVVVAVLSGDTFLVKYGGQECSNYSLIQFPFIVAPTISAIDNENDDQDVGIEAWNFLKELLLGKRVYVGKSIPDSRPQQVKIASFFDYTITRRVIKFADDLDFDIEHHMIINGFAHVRQLSNVPEEMKRDYQRYVSAGLEQNVVPFTKTLKLKAHRLKDTTETHPLLQKNVAEHCEMKVSIVGVDDESFLLQVMNEEGLKFFVELAGICHPSLISSPIIRNAASQFFVEFLFTRTALLRIHTRTNRGYLGTMVVNGRDIAATMLAKGLARINEVTTGYITNYNRFKTMEYNAKKRGLIIWRDTNYKPPTEAFPANVVAIPTSDSIAVITADGDEELYCLSGVRTPFFDFGGKADAYGLEAWMLVRDTVLSKEVYVTVDDDRADKKFATVTVGKQCLNELLLRRGLARLCVSRVRRQSRLLERFIAATKAAQEEKVGIFSEERHEFEQVRELNAEARAALMRDTTSRNFKAVVVAVTSAIHLRLYVPTLNAVITLALVGLSPQAQNEWTSRRAQELLRAYFLNHDVEVTLTRYSEHSKYFRGLVYDAETALDARLPAVAEGLVRFNPNVSEDTSDKQELEEKMEAARVSGRGVYHSESRNSAQIPKDAVMPVIVTKVVSETTLALQSQSDFNKATMQALQNRFAPIVGPISPDHYVVAIINGTNYRAQVIRIRGTEALVHLLDIGIDVWAFVSDLRQYTVELAAAQPHAVLVSLAFVKEFKNELFSHAAQQYITNIFANGQEVFVRRRYDRELPCVQLIMSKEANSMSLQYALCGDGIVQVEEAEVHPHFQSAVTELLRLMGWAREASRGAWGLVRH